MPGQRILTAALAAALALLAGCTSSSSPQGEAAAEDPCLVTAADDETCAQEAANATLGGGSARPHLHDYWNGATRLELEPVTTQAGAVLCTDTATVALLRPADGDSIIQGTGSVDITLTFPAQGATDLPATAELWVKTAAMQSAEAVGPAVSGETVTYATDDHNNDLPHQDLSAWEFHLVFHPDNAVGCFSYQAEVGLGLAITRGPQEIPLYPGHLDQWQNRTSIRLLDRAGDVMFEVGSPLNMCLSGDCVWLPFRPDPDALVPYDALEVKVTVGHTDPGPLRLRLLYHDATTRTFTPVTPEADTGNVRSYTIPVDDGGDGPYATQSQWEFFLEAENQASLYSGSYTLSAEAIRAPVAA